MTDVTQRLHSTPPWDWYTDPEHFDRERRLVLRTGWHHVGPVAHLNVPGRATPMTVAGMSIVIVADDTGTVRALPIGPRPAQSPVGPEAADPAGALDELPIAQWGPMLFVKPSHDGPDFLTVMGPLMAEIGRRVDIASLVPVESEAYLVQSNWKVLVENFNECYHCAIAHPEFNKVVHTNKRYEVERLGTYSVGHKVRLRADPDSMYYFAYAWPVFALGVTPDGTGVGVLAIRPETATTVTYARQLYRSADVEHRPLLAEFSENLVQQDIDLCEMVQRGLTSNAYPGGGVVEAREQAIVVFHELITAHMAEAGAT
jgi:carnitine monooxygenase subunit